jgi:hypothetical protein
MGTTPGRDKVVWTSNQHTKIIYEQHRYDVGSPDHHRLPHYRVDTPGQSHTRYRPGRPIPGYQRGENVKHARTIIFTDFDTSDEALWVVRRSSCWGDGPK